MVERMGALGRYPQTRLRRNRREAVVAPPGGGDGAHAERSDLDGLRLRRRGAERAGGVHARNRAAQRRPARRAGARRPTTSVSRRSRSSRRHRQAAKTPDGDEALNPDNLVCQAVRAVKAAVPEIGVICDVALDPYTSHGHDGLLRDGYIVNDETVDVLCRQALVQAEAGCDVIAPSDMMDGALGAIRRCAG